VSLLEKFLNNPSQTRYDLRVKFNLFNQLAADVFALIIFLCDDLLQLKLKSITVINPTPSMIDRVIFFNGHFQYKLKPTIDISRFFSMAKKLPMELQMVLCYRAVGSMKDNILCKDSEPAFKHLAKEV
jgi:hypothetical protein